MCQEVLSGNLASCHPGNQPFARWTGLCRPQNTLGILPRLSEATDLLSALDPDPRMAGHHRLYGKTARRRDISAGLP
jgi:hypothetical protein